MERTKDDGVNKRKEKFTVAVEKATRGNNWKSEEEQEKAKEIERLQHEIGKLKEEIQIRRKKM